MLIIFPVLLQPMLVLSPKAPLMLASTFLASTIPPQVH